MRMKERVTVTVDRDLIIQAKRFAHRRGTSLSGLVENSLKASIILVPRLDGSFVDRWAGKFEVRSAESHDLRLKALISKHDLR